MLDQYTYIFVIGLFFALLDAYNNGANDVANSWATSVSSRSISYRWAMILATVFEFLGALTVGARTADTIKNGIIPQSSFRNNAGVQMLAFTCALAAASSWVMWCTRHSQHVSSTYSLISAVAGVGVALAGANAVNWGWSNGSGMGAIFSGLALAPIVAGGFAAIIFSLIKFSSLIRKDPTWAIRSSPFFFLVAGTICTLSIVYKGSPNLGLDKRPPTFIAAVSLGVGGGLCVLSALFFVPFLHRKVALRDGELRWYDIFQGPLLWRRGEPASIARTTVPNFAVVQHEEEPETIIVGDSKTPTTKEEAVSVSETSEDAMTYKENMAAWQERFHARLRQKKGPLGWAMRYLHEHPMGAGEIYELKNIAMFFKRLPAMIVCAALYGINYDIHAAQSGITGPEAQRMAVVYENAPKYPNEMEFTYSFIQIISACTASFAHGASKFSPVDMTGTPAASKNPVPLWQIAVIALALIIGFISYGYKIMIVMGNKITYHSPSRGTSMELGAAITVLVFSIYKLPVSTSMCITGATVGVGLCSGFRAVNWQRVGLLFFSWIMTIPIAGTLGGVLMGIVLNAPRF